MGIVCRWLYSIGTADGSLPALTGLLVDHAKLWADPQATLLIFLPMKIKKNNYFIMFIHYKYMLQLQIRTYSLYFM